MEKILVPCASCSRLNRLDFSASRKKSGPLCGSCKAPLSVHGNAVEASGEGLRKLVGSAAEPVIIDFWAGWCGPCRSFAPIFEEASNRLGDRFHFVKLDTENDPLSAGRFQIRGIPTVVALKGGMEIARQAGAMPLEMFLSWLEEVEKPETKRAGNY